VIKKKEEKKSLIHSVSNR